MRLLGAATLSLLAASALAMGDAPDGPKPAPAMLAADTPAQREHAVEALFEVMHMEQHMNELYTKLIELQLAQMKQIPCYGESQADIRKFFQKTVNYKALEPQLKTAYTNAFTAQDMEDAAAFFDSAVGQKMAAQLPLLSLQASQAASAVLQEHADEVPAIYAKHVNQNGSCRAKAKQK